VRHLDETIAWFAVLHSLPVIIIEGETTQIRKLRRVAEHSERQVVWKLPKTIKIMNKLDVFLRRSVDINCSETERPRRGCAMASSSRTPAVFNARRASSKPG
jgi:hypothetical protein